MEKLANEVPKRQVLAKPDLRPRPGPSHRSAEEGADSTEAEAGTQPLGDADPTEGDPHRSCTSNWKAAATDEEKQMWGMFEETGIFACVCRHSFILWLVDMVRSGERYVPEPYFTYDAMLIIAQRQVSPGDHSGDSREDAGEEMLHWL